MIVGSDLPNRHIDSDETLAQNLNYVNKKIILLIKGLMLNLKVDLVFPFRSPEPVDVQREALVGLGISIF